MSNYKILFFLEKSQDKPIENIEISTAWLDYLWLFPIDFLQYSLRILKQINAEVSLEISPLIRKFYHKLDYN
jgi:hypothetical protein